MVALLLFSFWGVVGVVLFLVLVVVVVLLLLWFLLFWCFVGWLLLF